MKKPSWLSHIINKAKIKINNIIAAVNLYIEEIESDYAFAKDAFNKFKATLPGEIDSIYRALANMKNIILIFSVYAILIFIITDKTNGYNKSFLQNFLVNANSSILDFLVLGVILYYFEYRKQKSENISELLEDLENIAKHSSTELNIRKIKLIRSLNAQGVYHIHSPRMKINNLATVKYIKFHDAELSGLEFTKSSIRDCSFENCSIQALNLTDATLKNVTFINCKIKNMKAKNATLKNISFVNCFLVGSDFTNCQLKSCILKQCDLEGSKFNDADLSNANILQSTNIDAHALINAKKLNYLICDQDIKILIKSLRPEVKFPQK